MSSFEEVVDAFPEEQRCIQHGSGTIANRAGEECLFGVPASASHRRAPLVSVPNAARGFHFYLGSESARLVESFASSRWALNARYLAIGSSSYNPRGGVDYRASIEALGAGFFPKLKTVELGVWRLFSNSHCLLGQLGRLEAFLDSAPALEVLHLFGRFDLSRAVKLPSLRKLYVQQEDPVTGNDHGCTTETTLFNLLGSELPVLEDVFLDLETGDESHVYALPDSFLTGRSSPQLERLTVYGSLDEAERAKLEGSVVGGALVARAYPDLSI